MASLDKEDPKTKRVLANAMLTAEEEELVSNIVFLKNATSRKNQRRAPGKEEWEFVLSRYFPAVRDIFEVHFLLWTYVSLHNLMCFLLRIWLAEN